jgi:hypothetical protein
MGEGKKGKLRVIESNEGKEGLKRRKVGKGRRREKKEELNVVRGWQSPVQQTIQIVLSLVQ